MDAKIIKLPSFEDERGKLLAIEELKNIPFQIEEVYWISTISCGQILEGKAFKQRKELIVALSGSFDIVVDDCEISKRFSLNRSPGGLFVPQGLWNRMENVTANSIAMVLCSSAFSEKDHISEYDRYIDFIKESR